MRTGVVRNGWGFSRYRSTAGRSPLKINREVKMKRLLFVFAIIFASRAPSQMIADITEDVETEFGTYHPYTVNVQPSIPPYSIEPDFSNVSNYGDFEFTEDDESYLLQNAFCVAPSSYMEMYDIYNEAREHDVPIFITTDCVLHTYHLLYDKILKTAEEERFTQDLIDLTDAVLAQLESAHDAATDTLVREALLLDIAYMSVGYSLIDTTFTPDSLVDSLVEAELTLIYAHEGYTLSPIFEYREDYSQYVPRGHYTDSEALERYFRAMMWYGRMTFMLGPPYEIPSYDTRKSTRMAILLVYAIQNASVGDESAFSVWEGIYVPTVFFVGRTDDINIYQYTDIMEDVYGEDFASQAPDYFANESLLDAFITEADALPEPEITTWTVGKGFRFMGQRFIPDSYILDQLVYDNIPDLRRLFPKGLDVMSVLGSNRAFWILDEIYNETQYYGYEDKMDSLKVMFAALPDATWAQNLYWNWLYCLMPLLFPKGDGYPLFMQNEGWQDKEIFASLGSWAELRHDTILYAKQSTTELGFPPPPPQTPGYVEPNPYLYARLASLAEYMKNGLSRLGLLFSDHGERLTALKNLLLCLEVLSEMELENIPLSDEDYELINSIGGILQNLVYFEDEYSDDQSEAPSFDSDDQMPVVADVHTDTNTMRCLEEGVGYPFYIYTIAPIEGELYITRGACFSYFEFTQPISDRLTDEAWQEILQTDAPSLPIWVQSFVDASLDCTVPSPDHYWGGVGELAEVGDTIRPHGPKIFVQNPTELPFQLSYSLPRGCFTTLELYDIMGRKVGTIFRGWKDKGSHSAAFNGQCPEGVYFLRLTADGAQTTKKIIILK